MRLSTFAVAAIVALSVGIAVPMARAADINLIGIFGNKATLMIDGGKPRTLAAGDTTYDFDFLILPVKTANINASFTSTTANNLTSFTNTSTAGTTCLWDFGDGDTSTAFSPSHSFASSSTYNVSLKIFSSSPISGVCTDSVTSPVSVVITGVRPLEGAKKNEIKLLNNPVKDKLIIEPGNETRIKIYIQN